MFKSQLGKNIEVYIDDMVIKSKVVFKHVGDLGIFLKYLGNTSYALMLPNALLALGQASFWAIWSLIVKLRSIMIRLRQLIVYNHLEILKRSRS